MKGKRLRLSVFCWEGRRRTQAQALNKVEEEGAYRVNKLDPKWSGEEDKMQPSSSLTPPSVIYKATQEIFMQRSDLIW